MNTVQPIRDKKKIQIMKTMLKNKDEKYYIMFIVGINVGLRISDILTLRVSDVYEQDHVTIYEDKTDKKKRFLINEQMQRELKRYIEKNNLQSEDYLIQSRKGKNRAVGREQAWRVLNECGRCIGLNEVGTHTMRKTFGYWQYQQFHDVAMLMDLFNHSAPSITLRYIGITDDNKDAAMKNFFL